jgi:chemotaxis protein methyltransferase CheR
VSVRADGLSTKDLNRVCALIYEQSGISINPEKKVMLEARLKRRMNALKLDTYGEYCKYLFVAGHEADEKIFLIDAVSTNKTDFFREKGHFDALVRTVLPEFSSANGRFREFRIWSAGCSTGEEPYTLAMVLSEYARSHAGFRFRVLATDISTDVLAKAEQGVFTTAVARPVPPDLWRRYFMRSRDRRSDLLRVVPELRATVEFRRVNLMEEFGVAECMDAIFCRNVIIYFDRPTQERLFQKFARQLVTGGFMFVGHSESLSSLDVPFVPSGPALYRKADGR